MANGKLITLYVILILLFPFLAFSQNLSASQLQALQLQTQSGLSTQGGISMPEMAAARDLIAKGSKLQKPENRPLISEMDSLLFLMGTMDTLALDTLYRFLDSSFFKKDTLLRYEKIIFSQNLPSAFFEVQGMIPADYPLKSGDDLELSLWGAVERQLALSVNNQGNVFVEGAGLVNVANLTLGEAEKLITKKLQTVYSGIGQGRISVNLRTIRLAPTKVFVMGFVQRPGGYDLPGNANAFLALYRAGGPDDIGSVRNIIIRRANGDSTKIDLYDFLLRGKKKGEGLLRDGDLIFVPKAEKLVKATGTIGRPAIYELKKDESLGDLLQYSGGVLPNTDHTVSLWRIGEKGIPKVFEPGMAVDFANNSGSKEFQMHNGDSIFVFASTRPGDNSIEVLGSVLYPGYYTWSGDMGVREAVALAGGPSMEAFLSRAIVQRLNPDSSFSYYDDDFENTLGLTLLPNDKVIVLNSRLLKNWRKVSVAGFVKEPKEFEWQDGINAIDLIVLCGGYLPNASKDEIIIERIIPGELATKSIRLPIKKGLSVDNNKNFILEPGDRVVVSIEDSYYEHEVVSLVGALKNPGSYSLAFRGETFKNFMERVAIIDSVAYIKGGRLFRKPVTHDLFKIRANMNQNPNMNQNSNQNMNQNMNQSMNPNINQNMNQSMNPNINQNMNQNMNPNINQNMNQNMNQGMNQNMNQNTNQNMNQNTNRNNFSQNTFGMNFESFDQSYRINFDFERALKGKEKDIALQDGDSIFIPFDIPTVNITGEVVGPGHVLWQKGWKVSDYLNAAGGLTINGDDERVILIYANGQSTRSDLAKSDPDPGSEIFVSFKPVPEPVKMTEIITVVGSVVTALATIAAVIISIYK
ncbi:MAG: SLBB domain-containing protein [Candidatus Fibromonas sp.]|jgi:protein involved in polysaccharide export with SLBB domain|nr:SLBB domain-containing protein [Candidatus Fibromonas sp.]